MSRINGTYSHTLVIEFVTSRALPLVAIDNRGGAVVTATVTALEGGQPVSPRTIRHTLHNFGLHGCHPRSKPLLKMMHKISRKQFAEDKQTKDMDYWNHVLWSDETR